MSGKISAHDAHGDQRKVRMKRRIFSELGDFVIKGPRAARALSGRAWACERRHSCLFYADRARGCGYRRGYRSADFVTSLPTVPTPKLQKRVSQCRYQASAALKFHNAYNSLYNDAGVWRY